MSLDLSFWRYIGEPAKRHREVYASLSNGDIVEGLEELPITNILQSLDIALAAWKHLDATHFKRMEK